MLGMVSKSAQLIRKLPFPRGLLNALLQSAKVLVCRQRYRHVLRRLRRKVYESQKLKVIFLADDPAKWKYQSVYDLMARSDRYEPYVAIGLRKNHDYELSFAELSSLINDRRSFYERMGCRCVMACDVRHKTLIDMKTLGADIVFYQEPWMLFGSHTVMNVAKTALACYVPYSVEWEFDPKLHWLPNFHRLLFAAFVWNEEQAEQEKPKTPFSLSCFICAIGHTFFDDYCSKKRMRNGEYVIYAPHFSFPYNGKANLETLGTFEWNGREMLEYAKVHKEIKWAWKPHPALRWQLESKGFMTHEEVDEYYAAWEEIAETKYDGDYMDLFEKSRAMITDCGSFLLEYAPTGMPIIRPLAANFSLTPSASAQKIFETYYTAHNWDELRTFLDGVIVRGDDFRRTSRLKVVKEMCLTEACASNKVIEFMDEVVD